MATTSDADILAKIEPLVTIKGDCRIWGGSMCSRYNRPRTTIYVDDKQRQLNIQRYLWNKDNEEIRGSDILSTSCKYPRCINVDHLLVKKRKLPPGYTTPDVKLLEHIENNVTIDGDCTLWDLGSIGTFNRPYAKKYVDGKQKDVDVQRAIVGTLSDISRMNMDLCP